MTSNTTNWTLNTHVIHKLVSLRTRGTISNIPRITSSRTIRQTLNTQPPLPVISISLNTTLTHPIGTHPTPVRTPEPTPTPLSVHIPCGTPHTPIRITLTPPTLYPTGQTPPVSAPNSPRPTLLTITGISASRTQASATST